MKGLVLRSNRPSIERICNICQLRQLVLQHSRRRFHQSAWRTSNQSRHPRLPESPARTRFAPSPTGDLHLGSIRTALFNYLLAKRTGGQFLLRIEDTDQKRTVQGAEQRLYKDLEWAGLNWDEGPEVGGPYGPYRQSQRVAIYREYIQQLLKTSKAYRCFCSHERIDQLNRMRHDKGLPLGYDRKCLDIPLDQAEEKASKGEAYVVRFQVPREYPKYNDLVYGRSGHGQEKGRKHQFDQPVYDDPILFKSDGFPTYHLANVVDDRLMKITHVIRGSEWMSSTPLHVALYEAFGWTPPFFGHVPLLVDQNRQKLSKRNFDSDIASFRRKGIFPDSLVNFAALLGWSHLHKSDIMDLRDLEANFDLKITKGNTIVSFDKLDFLQDQHARRKINIGGEEFEQMIRDVAIALLDKHGARSISNFVGRRHLRDVIASMLHAESLSYISPAAFADQLSMFLDNSILQKRPALDVAQIAEPLIPNIGVAASTLLLVPEELWNRDVHRENLAQLDVSPFSVYSQGTEIEADQLKSRKESKKHLYHFLRWALLGGIPGPSIPETMEILGRQICEVRIRNAVAELREMEIARLGSRPGIRVEKGKGNSARKKINPEQEGKQKEWTGHKLRSAVDTSM